MLGEVAPWSWTSRATNLANWESRVPGADLKFRLADGPERLPLMFTLEASKPA